MEQAATPAPADSTQLKYDTILNKTFLDVGTYSLLGYGVGLAAGLFFARAAPIRNFIAGIGGSYGIVQNKRSFNQII